MIITPFATRHDAGDGGRKLARPRTGHPLIRESSAVSLASHLSDHSKRSHLSDRSELSHLSNCSEGSQRSDVLETPPPPRIPPLPCQFYPNSRMLVLATEKRLASFRANPLTRPHTTKGGAHRKISRTSRRVKSATSRSEATSDDDTAGSQAGESDCNWFNEPFDYDAELEDEDVNKNTTTRKDIHSVAVYKAACERFGQVPCRHVCRNLADRELELKNSHVDAEGAKAIAVALVVNGSIESVNLEGNRLGAKGTGYICEALQENTLITELCIAGNHLKTEGIQTLSTALGKNESLRILDISDNELEDFDAVHIADLLRENFALRTLIMHHNSMRERGGMILANAFVENDSVEHLNLSWNHLRRKGASAMCECLRKNCGLKTLNLAWNGLYLDGCRALRRALPENKTLVELDVSSNRLNEECVRELMLGMRRNLTCTTLKMRNSPLSHAACTDFLEHFYKFPTMALSEVDLGTQVVDIAFLCKYDSVQKVHPVLIRHGLMSPGYLQLADGETDSDVFINDDPMIVLMEYMRIQNFRLLDLFSSLDTDNSKGLSREEFRTGMLHSNIPLSAEALDKLIKNLDTNGDGEVDFNELLEGLKAHKKRVAKLMQRQKHLKFEDTDIGKVNLKINALLQFRMMFHKINLARSKDEQEAMQTTLQEYQDKLSDLSSLKPNMIQAGMERARAQAIERRISVGANRQPKLGSIVDMATTAGGGRQQPLTAKVSSPSSERVATSNGSSNAASSGRAKLKGRMSRALSKRK